MPSLILGLEDAWSGVLCLDLLFDKGPAWIVLDATLELGLLAVCSLIARHKSRKTGRRLSMMTREVLLEAVAPVARA